MGGGWGMEAWVESEGRRHGWRVREGGMGGG